MENIEIKKENHENVFIQEKKEANIPSQVLFKSSPGRLTGNSRINFKGSLMQAPLRPPLSKKVFPIRRVTPKKASREVRIFCFLFSIFH